MTFWNLNLTHTFSAISIRSSMYMNAQARCSLLWQPETRWNPIKSACKLSLYWGPCGVVVSLPWIQWAVTAINSIRLLLLHKSEVREIFPRDFWELFWISKIQGETREYSYIHLNFEIIDMILPNFTDLLTYVSAVWNIVVAEFFSEHEKDCLDSGGAGFQQHSETTNSS